MKYIIKKILVLILRFLLLFAQWKKSVPGPTQMVYVCLTVNPHNKFLLQLPTYLKNLKLNINHNFSNALKLIINAVNLHWLNILFLDALSIM